MSACNRLLAYPVLAAAVIGGCVLVCSRYPSHLLGDLSALARQQDMARRAQRRQRLLEERREAKRHVVDALFARRLNLLGAVAAFRDIHRTSPDGDTDVPEDLSDERVALSVLAWAEAELHDHPDHDPAVLAELEAELAALRGAGRSGGAKGERRGVSPPAEAPCGPVGGLTPRRSPAAGPRAYFIGAPDSVDVSVMYSSVPVRSCW